MISEAPKAHCWWCHSYLPDRMFQVLMSDGEVAWICPKCRDDIDLDGTRRCRERSRPNEEGDG